jgi:hypothetical protein
VLDRSSDPLRTRRRHLADRDVDHRIEPTTIVSRIPPEPVTEHPPAQRRITTSGSDPILHDGHDTIMTKGYHRVRRTGR